jgi:hypothetical protein
LKVGIFGDRNVGEIRKVRRRTSWLVGTATLATLAIFMMILIPALGSALVPLGSKTISAPYSGWVSPHDYLSLTGCAKGKLVVPAFFNLHRGLGGLNISTAAKSCKAGTNQGDASGQFDAYIHIPFQKNVNSIYANVTYNLSGKLALTGGTCTSLGSGAYCYRDVEVITNAYASLLDATKGFSWSSSGSFPYAADVVNFDTTCTSTTNCTLKSGGTAGPISITGSFSFVFPRSLYKPDKYDIHLTAWISTVSECVFYNALLSGCSASTSVNFATGGNGMVLTSIVYA